MSVKKLIILKYINTTQQMADILTKPSTRLLCMKFRDQIVTTLLLTKQKTKTK